MSERKYKYGEKTVLVSGFRVPVSKVQDFKDSAYAKLDSYMNKSKTVLDIVKVPAERFEKEDNGIVGVGKLPTIKNDTIKDQKAKANVFLEKNGYEIIDSVPLGSKMMEIIGHKVHKHHSEEIYYYKLSEGKGFKVVVLHSEKEVKDFIRKEIVK